MLRVFKEVKINDLLHSDYCVKHYQTIKTQKKILMIQEFCNCLNLEDLLKERGTLRQEEARIIMKQLVLGLKDLQSLKVVHRNLRLSNILLHFPEEPKLNMLSYAKKRAFLKQIDLTKVKFEAKIAGFNHSRVLEDTPANLSIVGTPLYQSP